MMKEEARRLQMEAIPSAQMPEVLRVAAELYAQDQSESLQAAERQQLVEAAIEVGLPMEYLERASAIVAARQREQEGARSQRNRSRERLGILSALSLAAGIATAVLVGWHGASSTPAPPAPPAAVTPVASPQVAPLIGPCTEVDLSPHVTQRLDEPMLPHPGNHLGTLLAGLREGGVSHRIMHGVPFRLDGVLLVGPGETASGDGTTITVAPQIEGIAIDRTVRRLHFLHGTHWRARDGAKIGAYIVHYADGARLEIPIRYGEDLRDWWVEADPESRVTRARVAWTGKNEASDRIRLYMSSWENPYPQRVIRSLDMVTGEQTAGQEAPAPFLVGLTTEQASAAAAPEQPSPNAVTK
jgi:hypothetical protein